MPYTPPNIHTERLLLRAITKADAPAIFEYARNPNVSHYTLWEPHLSLADSEKMISEYVLPSYSRGEPEPFGIERLSAPGKMVGTVGCFWVSKANECMELAYAISEDYWGQGLVAEAASAVLDYVFSELPVNRIQCRCKIENAPSLKVIKKLGFKEEGILRAEIKHRDRFWDMVYTSLLKSEWSNHQDKPTTRKQSEIR